jgi:hypothetical protein
LLKKKPRKRVLDKAMTFWGILTFRHFANVVFMEKLAGIALLAEALEPVLADYAGGAAVFVDVLVRLAKVEV